MKTNLGYNNFIILISLNIFFILGCSIFVNAQNSHWESVVPPGANWMYTTPDYQLPNNWNQQGFNDSSWSEGPSGIGYGDGDDATIISQTISLYMRKEFQIFDMSQINRIILDIDYDDGFVAYLNGVEIGRNLLTGQQISYNDTAEGWHEANLYRGYSPDRIFIDRSLLQNGINSLSVQVHNYSEDSSDLTALPVLSVEIIGTNQVYNETPFWFEEPNPEPIEINFQSSNLPIVILNTNGNDIPTEPKIPASIKIIKRPNDERNYVSDANNNNYINYDGPIQIEIRGASSTLFSKKQYAFTTFDEVGGKNNVSLLDLPKENDWILSGLAFDTTFIRDHVSYKLSNSIGQYTARTEYCELVLNGEYKGIYMLVEKLKADDSRINIKKIKIDDNTLPNLTGGYISKADKIEGEEILAWEMPNYGGWTTNYAHEHPSYDEITTQQDGYIQNIFFELDEKSLNSNTSFSNGYPSLIDIPSFVDFMLLNELASNPDAYQFSSFFHKDRRGKLRAGPIWDFNLTYGNDLFFWGFDRSKYDIWQFLNGNVGSKFWQNLFNDPHYNCYLSKRWSELSANGQPLSENKIFELIDQTVTLISEAVNRQELQWNIDIDFTNRINNIKSFVSQRITWLSSQLNDTSLCDQINTPSLVISKIHYHPPQSDDGDYEFIEITNNSGSIINTTGVYFGGLGISYQFPPGSSILPYQSVILANNAEVFLSLHGFSPYDEYSRKLSNNSEEIILLDGFGNLIDYVNYNDEAPWPTTADGDGAFLSLNNLNNDNSLASSWSASLDYNTLNMSDIAENQLFVYPSLFTKNIHISLTNGEIIEKVKVYDISGKLISTKSSNKNRDILNLSKLPAGVYFLEVNSDINSYSKKIIKSN